MIVNVRYFGLGTPRIPLELETEENTTVGQLILEVSRRVKEPAEQIQQASTFLVNNSKAAADTVLKDKDTLLILKILGGG